MFKIVNQQRKLDFRSRANEPIKGNPLDNNFDHLTASYYFDEHTGVQITFWTMLHDALSAYTENMSVVRAFRHATSIRLFD